MWTKIQGVKMKERKKTAPEEQHGYSVTGGHNQKNHAPGRNDNMHIISLLPTYKLKKEMWLQLRNQIGLVPLQSPTYDQETTCPNEQYLSHNRFYQMKLTWNSYP